MRGTAPSTRSKHTMAMPGSPGDPTRDTRRALFDTVFRHGSEEITPALSSPAPRGDVAEPSASIEGSGTCWVRPVLTVTTGDRRSGDRDVSETAPPSAPAWTKTPITLWDHRVTVEFLEYYKVRPEGMQVAISLKWNGRTLREIVEDAECIHILSDDLGIESRLHRLTFIAAVKAGMECEGAAAASATGRPHSDQSKPSMLAGEKALEIPLIPRGAPGQALPSQVTWKTFMTSVQGWGELSSEDYSYIISGLKTNPSINVEEMYTHLGAVERRIDLVLGTQLYNKATAEQQKVFVQQVDYMVCDSGDWKLSGLKILSYLGQKIVCKCTTSWLTLNHKFTKRAPVSKLSDLFTEINSILTIKDDLYNQGQPVADSTFFSVLHNAVSALIVLPELIVPLAFPVKDCEKQHGYSGDRLLEYLRGLEYDLTHNPLYKDARVPGKSATPEMSAGSQQQSEKPPKDPGSELGSRDRSNTF